MSEGMELWEVLEVKHHDDGQVTLTLRSEHGTVRTENYPPGAVLNLVTKHDD